MLKLFERVNKVWEAVFSDFNEGGILNSKKFLLWKSGNVEAEPFGRKGASQIAKIRIPSDSIELA